LDAERLQALAPIPVLKEAVKQAMGDIYVVWQHFKENNEASEQLRIIADVAAIGILFCNGFAGRSKEWNTMETSKVFKAIAEGKDYLTTTNHKTVAKYGEIGKWVAAGTWAALKLYIELPRDHGNDRLIIGSRRVVHKLLAKFGAVYTPGHQAPSTNLLRKLYPTTIHNESAKAMAFVARLDAHTEQVTNDMAGFGVSGGLDFWFGGSGGLGCFRKPKFQPTRDP
jgi:hypothetical protein